MSSRWTNAYRLAVLDTEGREATSLALTRAEVIGVLAGGVSVEFPPQGSAVTAYAVVLRVADRDVVPPLRFGWHVSLADDEPLVCHFPS